MLYRYIGNTLQSWVNAFPISNDNIGIPSSWYRIHDLRNTNIFNIPLAFLRHDVQYLSLGPKWYVVKVARQGNMLVIAAIEVMEQYPSSNTALKNSCNRKLGLNEKFSAVPPYIDGTSIVHHTSDGTPVFSVVREDTLSGNDTSSAFRWLALLLATLAIIYYQHTNKGLSTMFFGLGGLLVLQICTSMMVNRVPLSSDFFSPMIYADGYFNSFGALILFHSFIFLYCAVVFMSRKAVLRDIFSSSPVIRRAKVSALGISTILLTGYIHHTFRSLIFNSSINFDLYRINDISVYTIITYSAGHPCTDNQPVLSPEKTQTFQETGADIYSYRRHLHERRCRDLWIPERMREYQSSHRPYGHRTGPESGNAASGHGEEYHIRPVYPQADRQSGV